MEEKLRTTTVNGIYYGLMTGAGLIIISLILFLTDLYMNKGVSSIEYLVLIAGMVYGAIDYRKVQHARDDDGMGLYNQRGNFGNNRIVGCYFH